MHCRACDVILTDFEATRKYEDGTFVDLCNFCFVNGDNEDIVTIEREDLATSDDVDSDLFVELNLEDD